MEKSFEELVDDATHAAMKALGLDPEKNIETAEVLNAAIADIAANVLFEEDPEEED